MAVTSTVANVLFQELATSQLVWPERRACPPFLHEGVLTWVLKKAGPPAIELETVEAAMAFEKENRLSLLARVFVS